MTQGTCSSCEKMMAKAAMTRHVPSCGRSKNGPQALVISVCDRHAPGDYWLHLEVPASATLRALDGCLRDLWLECCGHLSAFEIDRRTYAVDADLLGAGRDRFDDFENESMDVGVGAVLGAGEEARHVYDMGSTTQLRVRCLEQRAGHGDGRIRLWRATPNRVSTVRLAARPQRRSAASATGMEPGPCATTAPPDIPATTSSTCRS